MLSLFPRPNSYTLRLREQHINERNRALCVPIEEEEEEEEASHHGKVLSDLSDSEIELQEGDIEILSSDLAALVEGVKTKRWTSTRMTQAFIRAARRAQLVSNPITVPNFDVALKQARQLDEEFDKTGELVGPLHGVPFSFKDQYEVEGLTATLGYSAWIQDGKSKTSAALAQVVRHLGGTIIAKTNVPQTMLSFECQNPLYGRTTNPFSSAHTCGGSSGGEAALLALDGAAGGYGSDIGGSLRIPTGYCGIYAIKPSKGRLPSEGTKAARHGFEAINVSYAPMCRSAADLELLLRLIVPLLHPSEDSETSPQEAQEKFGAELLRPSPLRTAWFDPLKVSRARKRPIRIGHYVCDGFVKTSPASIRALRESVTALQDAYGEDVELVEIDPKALQALESVKIFLHAVGADGFDGLLAPLRAGKIKEPMDLSLFLPVFASRASPWMRKIFYYVLKYVIRDQRLSYVLGGGGRKTAGEHCETVAQRDQFEKDFNTRVWKHYRLDAIIW